MVEAEDLDTERMAVEGVGIEKEASTRLLGT